MNHEIEIKKDSILGQLFGESLLINSYHHQGLEEVAPNFVATAWADAGGHKMVEAIEHESLPFWSVQWHPERMSGPVTNPIEAQRLMDQLFACENSEYTASGRRIITIIPIEEIERKF